MNTWSTQVTPRRRHLKLKHTNFHWFPLKCTWQRYHRALHIKRIQSVPCVAQLGLMFIASCGWKIKLSYFFSSVSHCSDATCITTQHETKQHVVFKNPNVRVQRVSIACGALLLQMSANEPEVTYNLLHHCQQITEF